MSDQEQKDDLPRPRMSEERMKFLLAEGRKIRLAVEKDIAEMRFISVEHRFQLCR